MIEGFLTMASYGLGSGGTIGNLLFQWEQAGVFSYVLPFLLIFALLFAILEKTNLFGGNKAVNVILSLAVGLMALQFNFVSYFFAEIFPRMGVLLSIIVVAMVLLGLFFDFEDDLVKKIFGGLIAVGVVVIIVQSFSGPFGWSWGFGSAWGITYWFERYGLTLLSVLLVVGLFVWMVVKGGNNQNNQQQPANN